MEVAPEAVLAVAEVAFVASAEADSVEVGSDIRECGSSLINAAAGEVRSAGATRSGTFSATCSDAEAEADAEGEDIRISSSVSSNSDRRKIYSIKSHR